MKNAQYEMVSTKNTHKNSACWYKLPHKLNTKRKQYYKQTPTYRQKHPTSNTLNIMPNTKEVKLTGVLSTQWLIRQGGEGRELNLT